ncbi:septal ring lytic transglycosylase RlpA family protein [Bradyrhizobium sp. UFLA05-109]
MCSMPPLCCSRRHSGRYVNVPRSRPKRSRSRAEPGRLFPKYLMRRSGITELLRRACAARHHARQGRYVVTFLRRADACSGTQLKTSHCRLVLRLFVRPTMRLLLRMVAIATVPVWMGLSVNPAAAQDFNDRWSVIPKAHAEPAPAETKQDQSQTQMPTEQEPARGSEARSSAQSSNRVFSGKASYYSYSKGKTASGSSFDRNLLTAAHRRLPFGTRVRVTDLRSNRSVVVRITDRGPWVRGRILDLSLSAARSLGIIDRGVAQIRAEVL